MSVLIGGSPVRLRHPPRRAQKEIFVPWPGSGRRLWGDPRRPSFSVDLKVSQATRSTYAVRYALFPSTEAIHRAGVQLRIQSRSLDRESPDIASQECLQTYLQLFCSEIPLFPDIGPTRF
jgi:hypothetical protein